MPTIFLCFDIEKKNICRTLTAKTEGSLIDAKDLNFDYFEVGSIPNSTYPHSFTTIANYKGEY